MENKFAFAKDLIFEAAKYIKEQMNGQLAIEMKDNPDDLVTNVDKETQDLIISRIKETYPKDNILAEENGVRHPFNDGDVWIIDPIDGTTNFIVQGDHFAIMIAYFEEGNGQFGLIYDPISNQLLSGGGKFDVYLNDQILSPYSEKPLDRVLIGCNSGMYLKNEYGVRNLIDQTLGVRIYGGAGISMMKVMTGQLFCYISFIQPWDYAAAMVIGKKLGYSVYTIDGKEVDYESRQKVIFLPEKETKKIQSFLNK